MSNDQQRNGALAPSCYSFSFPDDHLDPDAVSIIERLERSGHVAYMVGGCVRDLLLGLRPKDYDLATSASPRQAKRLFRNSRIIGRRFRLVHVFYPDKIIELSTFRRNGANSDDPQAIESDDILIRSDNVFGTPREDAMRRDFTINALFYSPIRGDIIDYVGGIDDLKARKLTTIGDPNIRFREDPVRIIRALKLSVRLGLSVDDATIQAIRDHAMELLKSSPPRMLEETYKILRSGVSSGTFRSLFESGVLAAMMPSLDESLRAEAPPCPDVLWRFLTALDDLGEEQHTLDNAVLLGAFLLPFFHSPFTDSAERDEPLEPTTDRGVHEIINANPVLTSVARRDKDLLRQILLAQYRLYRGGKRKTKRTPTTLTRRPYFLPAFELFKIASRATQRGIEDVEWWNQRLSMS